MDIKWYEWCHDGCILCHYTLLYIMGWLSINGGIFLPRLIKRRLEVVFQIAILGMNPPSAIRTSRCWMNTSVYLWVKQWFPDNSPWSHVKPLIEGWVISYLIPSVITSPWHWGFPIFPYDLPLVSPWHSLQKAAPNVGWSLPCSGGPRRWTPGSESGVSWRTQRV